MFGLSWNKPLAWLTSLFSNQDEPRQPIESHDERVDVNEMWRVVEEIGTWRIRPIIQSLIDSFGPSFSGNRRVIELSEKHPLRYILDRRAKTRYLTQVDFDRLSRNEKLLYLHDLISQNGSLTVNECRFVFETFNLRVVSFAYTDDELSMTTGFPIRARWTIKNIPDAVIVFERL